MDGGKNGFESFPEVVQDLLVPELKVVKSRRCQRASQALAEKFDSSVQIRVRLATLEARMPRQ